MNFITSSPQIIQGLFNTNVSEGGTTLFRCHVTGNPPPMVLQITRHCQNNNHIAC